VVAPCCLILVYRFVGIMVCAGVVGYLVRPRLVGEGRWWFWVFMAGGVLVGYQRSCWGIWRDHNLNGCF
jgi:hypothetical protein